MRGLSPLPSGVSCRCYWHDKAHTQIGLLRETTRFLVLRQLGQQRTTVVNPFDPFNSCSKSKDFGIYWNNKIRVIREIRVRLSVVLCVRVRHFSLKYLEAIIFFRIFAPSKKENMSYTKEITVISNPSAKLLKAIEDLKRNKNEKLEKLRNMKPEEFSRRVILA